MRTTQEKIYFFERCFHEIASEIERRSFRTDEHPPLIDLMINIQSEIKRLKHIKKYHEKQWPVMRSIYRKKGYSCATQKTLLTWPRCDYRQAFAKKQNDTQSFSVSASAHSCVNPSPEIFMSHAT
jgi:hypothetical protein